MAEFELLLPMTMWGFGETDKVNKVVGTDYWEAIFIGISTGLMF